MHIAIILDGNRRFARKKGIPEWKGHEHGAKKVNEMIEWCNELGVKELTLYAFSMENFDRPKKEVKAIFKLFEENIKKLRKSEDFRKKDVKVRFIGRLDMFPKGIVNEMKWLMAETDGKNGLTVNFAMAYGGRQEIVDAVKKIAPNIREGKIKEKDIDEKLLNKNMYLISEPELVIRPGGERRISNFLIWQSYYSEWHFTEKLWPEFTKEDLIEAINDYKNRERRFGL